MNMLAHHQFAVSDDDGPATATIELDVPMYVGSTLFCEFPAEVSFIRDETERDGFHIEEMIAVDLRTGYPGKIVRQYNGGGPLDHDMACAIIKEFGTEAALRSAEEAMKKAEHEDNQPGPFGLRPVRGERA